MGSDVRDDDASSKYGQRGRGRGREERGSARARAYAHMHEIDEVPPKRHPRTSKEIEDEVQKALLYVCLFVVTVMPAIMYLAARMDQIYSL